MRATLFLNCKKWRLDAGFPTVSGFARSLRISEQRLSEVERGLYDGPTLQALSRFFGKSIDELRKPVRPGVSVEERVAKLQANLIGTEARLPKGRLAQATSDIPAPLSAIEAFKTRD